MIIDTHGHYDDEQFDVDREMLLTNLKERGLKAIVTVGASMQTSENALALAHQYPAVYAAVGVHPDEVGELNDDALARLEEMCHDPKVVAVGEIGLDYHWDVEPREVQQKWFIRQLDLARKVGLPVNIHSRDASEDTFRIIKEHASDLTGIIHCFSGSKELAAEYVKLGYYIGVGGVVTFKNGKKLKSVVEAIPLTSIVLETDCPYLAPEPNRGKRNESAYIRCWQYHKLKICEVICRKFHTILITFFIDIVYNIFNGNSAGTRRTILPVPALEPNEHKLLFVHLAYGLME